MRLFIKIKDGVLQSVYGDEMPEGVWLDVILRDMDNIDCGDPDPDPNNGEGLTYYW